MRITSHKEALFLEYFENFTKHAYDDNFNREELYKIYLLKFKKHYPNISSITSDYKFKYIELGDSMGNTIKKYYVK